MSGTTITPNTLKTGSASELSLPETNATPPPENPAVDLSTAGAPGNQYTPDLELSRRPSTSPLLDKAKNELLAEFRFAQGAGGGLSPRAAQPFAGCIADDRLADLASGKAQPEVISLSEGELANKANGKAMLSFFKKAGQFGEFTSDVPAPDGTPVKIRYGAFLPPEGVPIRAVLNLNSGRTECMLSKYAETLYELRELIASGVAIVMNDHRGQGFSDRLLPNADKGYVEHFDDYTKDVDKFTRTMEQQLGPRLSSDATWTLAGHSMGGGIVARYLEEFADKNPYSQGLGLSPMLGVQVLPKGLPLPLLLERLTEGAVVDVLNVVGGTDYAPGKGDYAKGKFDGNTLTGSKARYDQMTNLEESYRPLQIGGPTDHWAEESVNADKQIALDAAKLDIPFTIIRSGDDKIVNVREQDDVADKGHFKVISFRAKEGELPIGHELLQERDSVRNEVLDLISAPLIAQLEKSRKAELPAS